MVPGDFPTIQAAINDPGTVSGDTIVLTASLYTGAGNIAINTNGKSLTIRSASDNPDDCLIDCQSLNRALNAVGGGTVTVQGITFANGMNVTGNVGGGLFVQNSTLHIANCRVMNCRTRSNIANNFCAGAVAALAPAQLTITNSELLGNRAAASIEGRGSGAAIFVQHTGADAIVESCLFSGNVAVSSPEEFPPTGGAISVWEGASMQLNHSIFEANEAVDGIGGDVFISDHGLQSVFECSFEGGSAARGGALYAQFSPSVQIRSCEFVDCQASLQGGAIELYETDLLDVSGTTFDGCDAGLAGAIIVRNSGMRMDRCTLQNCIGTVAVSALFVEEDFNLNDVTVTNTLIANNTCPWFGAIAFTDASLADHLIANCTIVNNTNVEFATGSAGLEVYDSAVSVVNSILFFNDIVGDQSSDAQFEAVEGGNVSIRYCSIQNLSPKFIGMNGAIDADPLFVDPIRGNYHLSPNSPCIDAADNFYPDSVPYTLDLDNNERKNDVLAVLDTGAGVAPIVDMGAYEVPGSVCPPDIVNTNTFQPPPDGQIDGADLAFLLGEWGANPGSLADIVDNSTLQPPPDGIVDGADLAVLLGAWGACK